MSDIVLNPIGSGYNLSKFNVNFQALEEKINSEILHLTGGNNVLEQNIDMNSNRLINLPVPESSGEPVRLKEIEDIEGSVSAEKEARISADNQLQDNIDFEANTRSAADTTLQNNINEFDDLITSAAAAGISFPLDCGLIDSPVDPNNEFDLGDIA